MPSLPSSSSSSYPRPSPSGLLRGSSTRGNRSKSSSSTKKAFVRLLRSRRCIDLKRFMLRSFKVSSLPVRIRPAFIILVTTTLLLLSLLGFHPTLANQLTPPITNGDKLLHFICFAIASALFWNVWEIEESVLVTDAKWRWGVEILSVTCCCFVGGIGSEWVQSWLPYKTFQMGDVVANILGSSLGILLARTWSKSHRRAIELERLYPSAGSGRIILDSASEDEDDVNDDDDDDEPLLPMNHAPMIKGAGGGESVTVRSMMKNERNVWDDNDRDLFSLGDGGEISDDDNEMVRR